MLYGLKTFFDPNSALEELAKISSPNKPIESKYFDLHDHVREVADLLCSCKFTLVVDGGGWWWMVVDGGGWWWMVVDGGGWWWMVVDDGG